MATLFALVYPDKDQATSAFDQAKALESAGYMKIMEQALISRLLRERNNPDEPLLVAGNAGQLSARSHARTAGHSETGEPQERDLCAAQERIVHQPTTFFSLEDQYAKSNPTNMVCPSRSPPFSPTPVVRYVLYSACRARSVLVE